MSEQNYAGLTKEEQQDAIRNAASAEELEAIWGQLEPVGYSRDGMMFASLLERKRDLGGELTDEENVAVNLAAMRRKEAEDLPPVEGKLNLGGE